MKHQKMLINVFVDKIYLYDDHFTIYLNNSKKGTNTSKKEVELAEQYFFEPSSESTSGCVPIAKPRRIICETFLYKIKMRNPQNLSIPQGFHSSVAFSPVLKCQIL